MSKWADAQIWEKAWWNNCANTFGEEMKQLLYASRMGLVQTPDANTPYRFDMQGKSILDIGGGPTSLLLKCVNFKKVKVIDPLKFPFWIKKRYESAGIEFQQIKAEKIKEKGWDEIFIYNTLQHTDNVEQVIKNIKKAGKIIRLFEWLDTPVNIGHPQCLTEKNLNRWLGGKGRVDEVKGQNNCWGRAFYGIFIGKKEKV